MPLRVMRLDKKEEPRADEIMKDWRQWATDNGYVKKASVPVEQGHLSITLETWEHCSAIEDAYLFYHPEVPTTADTEVLYIVNDQEKLERMVGISKHMASDLMKRVQLYAEGMRENPPDDQMNGNS